MNDNGTKTPQPTNDLNGDQETVELLTKIPRDLSKLSVGECVELLRMLRKVAEFGKEPPSSANTLARQLFAVINEELREIDPEIPRLMESEALLSVARDAAQKMYEQYLSEKARVGKPLGAALALYLVSIAVGGFVLAVVGAVVALWAFGRSTLCRTFRAAMHMKVADMLDKSKRTPL
jgi:hypothetical protein